MLELNKPVSQDILNMELQITGQRTVCLKDFAGQNIVIYFYPKNNTPGCIKEGLDFSRAYDQFQSANTYLLGVSRDSIASHEGFKKRFRYKMDLASDTHEKLSEAFGVVKEPNRYAKMVFGLTLLGIERSTFVLNKRQELIKEWRKVSIFGHVKEVLNYIKALE